MRARRYVAKYTINPAIAHGVSHDVGSVEVGQARGHRAVGAGLFRREAGDGDKGGFIAYAQMGDANASIPTPQPYMMRPMFGAFGRAPSTTCLTFLSKAAYEAGVHRSLGLSKQAAYVSNCRSIGKKEMIHNNYMPKIEVDPERYIVRADGEVLTCKPAPELPLAQRYFLF